MKICPYCAEEIQDAAIVCKHCGRDLSTIIAHPPTKPIKSKPPTKLRTWLVAITIIVFICVCGLIFPKSNNKDKTSPTQTATSVIIPTEKPIETPTPAPTEQITPESEIKEEKIFLIYGKDGEEISAYVYADSEHPDRKMIIFTPFLDKTDGDLYNASLNALWNIYGKERGLFQLENAKTEHQDDLNGNAICWTVSNPQEDFCVFPIKDSDTNSISSLLVWIK